MNVLIVEDDKNLKELYCMAIDNFGLNVKIRCIGTIEEAAREFLTHRPDLIILDFILPDGHGHEVIKLAKQFCSKRPKIALITAWNVPETDKNAMEVDHFLKKPFDLKVFEDLIVKLNEEFITI